MKKLIVIIISAFICGTVLKSCGAEKAVSQESQEEQAVIVPVKSSECDILKFMDETNSVNWEINGTSISATYSSRTDLSSITPDIVVSENASISPQSGTAVDLSNGQEVTYTVTAEDGTGKIYRAQAKVVKSVECDILSFVDEVNSVKWKINGVCITAVYPAEIDLCLIEPSITVSEKASVYPPSGTKMYFSNESEVTYTVTAEDGTVKTYKAQATGGSGTEISSVTDTKWKLVGMVDAKTSVVTELEPKNREWCYTFTFDDPKPEYAHLCVECKNLSYGFVTFFTQANEYSGCYEYDYKTYQIQIFNFGGTKVGETGDGLLYSKLILSTPCILFRLQNNKLRFDYNENKNFLLYKQIQP